MSTTTEIDLGVSCVGNTDRIELTFTKDGADWNSIESVVLTFERPDCTTFERNMVLLSGDVWYYDTTPADLDQAGTWRLSPLVTQGGVAKRYPYEVALTVTRQP
jgi:hypothetical protein